MSQVLFLYERDMPTVSITRECMSSLDSSGVINNYFCRVQDINLSKFNNADVLFFIRPNDSISLELAKQAKESGRLVVVMYDDDLLNLPDNIPFAHWRKKNMVQILNITDVLVSSSQYLLDIYKSRFKINRVGKIDTIVREDEFSSIQSKTKEKIKLVYAAGPKHVELFNQFILPIMPLLCKRYGKKLSLTCVGVYPDLDCYKNQMDIEIVKSMPLLEYRKYMQEQCFDVGLAPLVTNDFTKCKYFNKYLEYTTANIIGIYSKTEPYIYVVEDGVNGFLASDDSNEWFQKLCQVIDDADLRNKCLNNAVEYIKINHSSKEISNKLLKDIPELKCGMPSKEKFNKLSDKKIIYKIYRLFDYIYLSYFYLKNTGVKGFVYNLKVHIRESNSYR